MNPKTTHLHALFEDWLRSRPARSARARGVLREESADVYRDMWGSFVAFCHQVQLDPLQPFDVAHLRRFLEARPLSASSTGAPMNGHLSPRYGWRMLHLIDRVLTFACMREGRAPIHAPRELMQQPPYVHANAAQQDPLPQALSDAQAGHLIHHLQNGPAETWKSQRDAAAVAVMLGAGLSPGDVRALPCQGIACDAQGRPWRLTVPADGTSPQHHAPLAPWAAEVLMRWLRCRQALGIPGPQAFPSTRAGKAWAHPSCHKALVAVLNEAGIPGGSPFRLRHTFALRQLRDGVDEAQLARWLGHVDTLPVQRLRALLSAPAHVV